MLRLLCWGTQALLYALQVMEDDRPLTFADAVCHCCLPLLHALCLCMLLHAGAAVRDAGDGGRPAADYCCRCRFPCCCVLVCMLPRIQALLYAMQVMEDDQPLSAYHVPPGCKVLVAVEAAKLGALPDPDSAYWN
jgi:hypothetical protein